MADPVTDPVAEHNVRYGEEGAGPPEGARVRDRLAAYSRRASGSTGDSRDSFVTRCGIRFCINARTARAPVR
jgi:hypothetical protein